MYKKWIQSYRDLPILINQWCNVIRWEKRTRLFLRTTEFLWQEGHTAHATAEEAEEETLRCSASTARSPRTTGGAGLDGVKTDSEKFAGAVATYCIEALMQDRKSLQAGTSHYLGQNFAKAFDVTFQTRDKTLEHVWATSWGVSTRLIGGVIMTHSDDNGLGPAAAARAVRGGDRADPARQLAGRRVLPRARELRDELTAAGIRVMLDDRDAYTPGWKFAEWELHGVPVRLEIGPKDIEKQTVFSWRGATRARRRRCRWTGWSGTSTAVLDEIQQGLFERALKFREERTSSANSYDEFVKLMEGRPGFVISPWCGSAECEPQVKAETQATIRNVPFVAPKAEGACIKCGQPAVAMAYLAKAVSTASNNSLHLARARFIDA